MNRPENQVQLISWATAVRWIGWGMMEPIAIVFLYTLVKSYGLATLIDSLPALTFFFLVPIAGLLADRVPLKTFLMWGLFFFFTGGLWSLSVITHNILYIIISDIFCGVALASDVVGRATYIRRYIPEDTIATVMGSQNTLLFLGTLIGCCITLIIIPFVSLAWIFFWIIPTNLFTLVIFSLYLKKDIVPEKNNTESNEYSFKHYFNSWKEINYWQSELKLFAGLTLFLYTILSFCDLLIPIYAFTHGANYQQVILLYILAILPQLLSSPLGKIADKYKHSLLSFGLGVISVTVGLFAFFKSYIFMMSAIFVLQIIVVLLCLVVENVITEKIETTHYGRVSSVFEGLKEVGKYVGVIGLGFIMDHINPNFVFLGLAILTIGIGVKISQKFYFLSSAKNS